MLLLYIDYDKIGNYVMTAKEIMNRYGINKMDIPVFGGFSFDAVEHDHLVNFSWNEIFKRILNKKFGGNTKDILYSSFNASMWYCVFVF